MTPADEPSRRLGRFMRRVLDEHARATKDLSADAVHDLRVALRRCRSIARAVMDLDPGADWRHMRKAGRRLFRALGDLRDVHVMREWVRALSDADDRVHQAMVRRLDAREVDATIVAREALGAFDRPEWQRLARRLAARMRTARFGPRVRAALALDRYEDARERARQAERTRSATSHHRLRIALKRFRYTVETFLPRQRAAWEEDLKRCQDLLGAIHDLDVLWSTLREAGPAFDPAARTRWRARWQAERRSRLAQYRAMMRGPGSCWNVWRAGLPHGDDAVTAARAKLRAWAGYRDPDAREKSSVAARAGELFRALGDAGVPGPFRDARAARILDAAALLHEVGRIEGKRRCHEASYRLILALAPPVGWTHDDIEMVALVSRHHRGGAPGPDGPLACRPAATRATVQALAGVLRLARVLARVPAPITVTRTAGLVLITLRGGRASGQVHVEALRKKWLLELACGQAVSIVSRRTGAAPLPQPHPRRHSRTRARPARREAPSP